MDEFAETPHRAVVRLLTGHFREKTGYRGLRRQGVGDWLLIHTLSGRGRFGHAAGDLMAEPGDWVLLRPGTPHDYGVEPELERWELVWAHFQPRHDWLAWMGWPAVADGLMHLRIEGEAGQRLAQQFLSVHAFLHGEQARREEFAMNALEAVILGCHEQSGLGAIEHGDARIRRAMDYLDRHVTEKVSVEGVAAAVALSASRLAHLFRQETGQTVQVYLEDRRMQIATDLLRRTSFPVKQVAAAAGYDNPFYFSLRFKRWTGLSPVRYRQKHT